MADPSIAWPDLVKLIPEAAQDNARIKHVTIAKNHVWFSQRATVIPGTYCQLYVDGRLMMSDTPDEKHSNTEVLHRAKGDVLIAGLGIGMIVVPILHKPHVRSVTVVELSADVIDLVGGPLFTLPVAKTKLYIDRGDIFTWKPWRAKYDTIYFDIWPTITTANLKEMTRLHRRFGRHKNPDGWMGSWQRGNLRRLKQTGRL